MKLHLHPIQRKLLYIADKINYKEDGLRNIGRKIGVSHPQKIVHHLNQLEAKKLIKINRDTGEIERLIQIEEPESDVINIPIYGFADCGNATVIAEQKTEKYLQVSKNFYNGSHLFAIHAVGQSMNKKINNGDFVIINPDDKNYQNDDIVLVVIDDCATIKKYKEINANKIGLYPDSSDKNFQPIFITPGDKTVINGKVIDVLPGDELALEEELIYEPVDDM
ncbi:MAG: S24 family peptidase [Patescibacteria group bacterium]|nr:S24 family peptidase [Patescibacteria group bacterium]MDD5294756.1 S24 family peptidase [Patescibacteria group bacterium]MDD5554697.1 S24 family peptidase [Patescibacteria group bacterium]